MTERRLNPAMPGLEIVGDSFDTESGLPKEVRVAGLGMAMLLVPAGEVEMGSEAWRDAQPVHAVFAEPFYLGKFEVTQKEWSALGFENPSEVKGEKLPVHGVSWSEARGWIGKLNARTGGAFRLPTEAEWERAAKLTGSGENIPLSERAWFRGNSATSAVPGFRELTGYAPRAVGMKRPSPAGFFDLQGNVAEWCSSLIRPYPFDGRDGREADDSGGAANALRAVRGGAFADAPEYLDPAFRHSERSARRSRWIGLRLAR